jgi:aromatic ring-opening dioxygenase LigB subunit
MLSVTVPPAGRDALAASAAGLRGAAEASDRRVAVVAAGDLAATLTTSSPGYLVEGADAWDATAVDAVRATDPDAMTALGPADAARVQARGWAPLVVLLRAAARQDHRFGTVRYHAPRGVGQLVAR